MGKVAHLTSLPGKRECLLWEVAKVLLKPTHPTKTVECLEVRAKGPRIEFKAQIKEVDDLKYPNLDNALFFICDLLVFATFDVFASMML
mmetsp:Transcript_33488/g.42765  ORF Transcript_33488/g.42765 Transcript_33488/m.42765 type:complete len:89 (+) Transcript_33488:122-388(+)